MVKDGWHLTTCYGHYFPIISIGYVKQNS